MVSFEDNGRRAGFVLVYLYFKFTITKRVRSDKIVNSAQRFLSKRRLHFFTFSFMLKPEIRMEGYQVHMTLDELHIGRKGRITAVGGEGILRCRLLDMGLIPQTIVSVTKVAPMGDPMELLLRGYSLTLRKEDARSITVEEVPE